jgi:hypothetical protein
MFIAYFFAIWLWYLWLIPLILLTWILVYSVWDISLKWKVNSLVTSYWLFLAWIIIMIWFFLSAKFFDVSTVNSILFLVALNILFFVWSYLFKYEDGKQVSHVWFLVSILALLIYVRIVYGARATFQMFSYSWILYFALIWFTIFVLWIKYDITENLKYLFFVLAWWAIILTLHKIIPNLYVFLIVLVILLQVWYSVIYYILEHKPPTLQEQKDISVRRILAWERILKKQEDWKIKISQEVYDFVSNMPQIVKYCLEWINTFIILLLIYLYFKNTLSLNWSVEQVFYWVIMLGFIVNVYTLKKIDYTSIFQRLITFLVINFAIYISLFSAFKWDIESVALFAIVRNLLSTSLVFSIHKTKVWTYLKKIDYSFWIFTTLLALIVNIILLFNTQIQKAFLLPMILLYVWIQWFLVYYSIKYIKKIQEVNVES